MDLSHTIEANSEQINADDLSTPRTVTITDVEKGTADQPVFVHVSEFTGRTYRPGKSMRRVLVAAWGADASLYKGRRLTIFNDPSVKWAGQAVGGVRISHMSHIDKPLTIALTLTRGKRAPFTVQPLPDATPARDWLTELDQTGGDADLISALGTAAKTGGADADTLAVIRRAYQNAKGHEK